MKMTFSKMASTAALAAVVAVVTLRVTAGDTNSCGGSCCAMGTALADTNAPAATADKVQSDLLMTCPVSGDKLGEMGECFRFVYEGQEVKLCCASCKKDFLKDPKKYLAIIRAADKK